MESKSRYLKKILIIEDDPTFGKGIQMILKPDYDVTLRGNSLDALSFIEEDKPGLIITDLYLDDINGLEIYERFNKKIPTLIITGSADTKLAQKATKIASDSFIARPFLPKMLKVKIDELLTKKNKEKTKQ